MSKNLKMSWENSGHPGTPWDVIPINDIGLLAFHFYSQIFYTCMKRHWKDGSGKLRVMEEGGGSQRDVRLTTYDNKHEAFILLKLFLL